jgi:hypothetical protein
MKNLRIAATLVGLLTPFPAFGLAQANAGTSPPHSAKLTVAGIQPRTANMKATVHATKGVVKSVDAGRLVIKRTPQDGREMAFVLNPSTERSGDVKVGSTVDVRYRADAEQRIATAVIVVPAKQPPSAPGSHQ